LRFFTNFMNLECYIFDNMNEFLQTSTIHPIFTWVAKGSFSHAIWSALNPFKSSNLDNDRPRINCQTMFQAMKTHFIVSSQPITPLSGIKSDCSTYNALVLCTFDSRRPHIQVIRNHLINPLIKEPTSLRLLPVCANQVPCLRCAPAGQQHEHLIIVSTKETHAHNSALPH
jgi:hypothetical protein